MQSVKVALLGLGTVGKGVYDTIGTHQNQLQEVLGKPVEVVAVLIQDSRKLRDTNPEAPIFLTTNYNDILNLPQLDVVIEMIGGREPARSYIIQALSRGSHVITANKELIAFHGAELKELANYYGVQLAYEASVAGGIPIIRTLHQLLQINQIIKIEGILNGTTNYILSQMRTRQISFDQAIKEAQLAGYAEADPTNDIKGWDTFYKLMVLSDLVFQEQPNWSSTEKIGIDQVTIEELLIAESLGLRLKLVASLTKDQLGVSAKVEPTFLTESHLLYGVEGVDNAIVIETDIVGRLFFQGPGAGALPTASAIIEDLVYTCLYPKIDDFKAEKNGKDESQKKTSPSFWLLVHKHDQVFSNIDESYWNTRFNQHGVQYYSRKTLEHTQNGYVSGHLIKGSEEKLNQLLNQISHQDKIKYYPVLAWENSNELITLQKSPISI